METGNVKENNVKAVIPELLTLDEVAKVSRLSKHTIRALIRKGKLHPTRIVRRLLFDASEVSRFLMGRE